MDWSVPDGPICNPRPWTEEQKAAAIADCKRKVAKQLEDWKQEKKKRAYVNSVASNGHRRMAKRRNRPGMDRVTVHAIKSKQAMFDGCCAYCGCKPERLAMDHFLPLSRGGFHTPSNLIPACKSCNSSKSNKEAQAWFKAQPFYSADRWALILERMTEQGQMALF
jgi:5-methylcytosine-specific restriction endonuclease McrA